MTETASAVDHLTRRLVVALTAGYDDAREHYERLVPAVDQGRFAAARSWDEVLDVAGTNAPHGFMRYHRADVTAAMAGSASHWCATQYLMGNHTIAETMFRHDPAVMLHAPLRTLIYVDATGTTRFSVDQPSLQFASFDTPEITAVGHSLDTLLARLIELLGGHVPAPLAART